MTSPRNPLRTPAQVAEELGMHRDTVYDLIHARAFPGAIDNGRTGNGRRYRIPQSDVDSYRRSHLVAA